DAADDADQCGLAGAVRPQQRKDLAAANVEVDALERLEPGRIGLGQVRNGDDGFHEVPQRLHELWERPPSGAKVTYVYRGRMTSHAGAVIVPIVWRRLRPAHDEWCLLPVKIGLSRTGHKWNSLGRGGSAGCRSDAASAQRG